MSKVSLKGECLICKKQSDDIKLLLEKGMINLSMNACGHIVPFGVVNVGQPKEDGYINLQFKSLWK